MEGCSTKNFIDPKIFFETLIFNYYYFISCFSNGTMLRRGRGRMGMEN